MQPVFAPRTSRARVAPWVAGVLALTLLPLGFTMAFAWAPVATIALDGAGNATQHDFAQKIFYLHVPIAFAAYLGFVIGAWNGLLYLVRGEPEYDVRSYVGVHVGVVFGTLVLATGSIWAKAAWGVWWQWGDRQLLVFLILFLFYCSYFMLRFSLDAGAYRARVSAVYALLGIALVPLSFLAIRVADTLIHPVVITGDGLAMTSRMGWTFAVSCVGFLALATWMAQLETAAKLGMRSGTPAPSGRPGSSPIVSSADGGCGPATLASSPEHAAHA